MKWPPWLDRYQPSTTAVLTTVMQSSHPSSYWGTILSRVTLSAIAAIAHDLYDTRPLYLYQTLIAYSCFCSFRWAGENGREREGHHTPSHWSYCPSHKWNVLQLSSIILAGVGVFGIHARSAPLPLPQPPIGLSCWYTRYITLGAICLTSGRFLILIAQITWRDRDGESPPASGRVLDWVSNHFNLQQSGKWSRDYPPYRPRWANIGGLAAIQAKLDRVVWILGCNLLGLE